MSTKVVQPFPTIHDIDGKALEGGFVFIGVADLNPESNPVPVFFDSDLTIPAAQPIRTVGGYFSREGSPANIFVDVNYSITVKNKKEEIVYSLLFN